MSDVTNLLLSAMDKHVTWTRFTDEEYRGQGDVPEPNTYAPPCGYFNTDLEVDVSWLYDGELYAEHRGTNDDDGKWKAKISSGSFFTQTPGGRFPSEYRPFELSDGTPMSVQLPFAENGRDITGTVTAVMYFPLYMERADRRGNSLAVTLFDMLALFALEDAKTLGREDDVEALTNALETYVDLDSWETWEGFTAISERVKDERGRLSRRAYVRRKDHNVTTSGQIALIDPLTNAVTESGKGAICPADYFVEGGREVDTGSGGIVLLDMRAPVDADLDDVASWVIDDRTRYWLDHAYALLLDSDRFEVTGTEILQHAGYRNPYDRKGSEVLGDAARNIEKATRARVGIDVTKERRNKRRGNAHLIESIELRPVVDGTLTLDRYRDGDEELRDFTLTVKPRVGETVLDALPLAKYAKSREMLTSFSQDEITFDGIRQTLDDRQMWAYVLRRIKSKKMSGTIRFETMWRDLKIEDGRTTAAARKKKDRMTKTLERMLDQKAGEVFSSWAWAKDTDGRVTGVTIRRKRTRNPSKKN